MSLDVLYQGLPIAKSPHLHFEDGALFVEVEAPMPVATQLVFAHEDKSFAGRVRRVREGTGAGMLIVANDSAKLPRWLMALHPDTAHAAQFEAEAVAAPPAAEPSSTKSPVAAEHTDSAAPSNHTPESEAEGESEDDKHAKAGDKKAPAAKKPKKPRRR